MMQSTRTNIKFSPGRELYPGTQERVCVIMGGIGNIVQAVKGVFDKVRSSEQYDQDILKNLKLLISNISSGMIIGKSGGTIKMLQQEFNIRIQITNKEETKGLPERTMIMISESPENIYSALANILERIMHDPESDKWRRLLSYTTYSATPTTNTTSTLTIMDIRRDDSGEYSCRFANFLGSDEINFSVNAVLGKYNICALTALNDLACALVVSPVMQVASYTKNPILLIYNIDSLFRV